MSRNRSNPADKIVGRNVRVYRLSKGMSQTQLAEQLGVTFQQVQKYEKGSNRIGSGRLAHIAKALDVPISAFFEGVDKPQQGRHSSVFDQLAEPQSFRLMQAFSEIADPSVRRSLVELVVQMAGRYGRR
jgi:transcriptional regulator with XRE-family HTH domain